MDALVLLGLSHVLDASEEREEAGGALRRAFGVVGRRCWDPYRARIFLPLRRGRPYLCLCFVGVYRWNGF